MSTSITEDIAGFDDGATRAVNSVEMAQARDMVHSKQIRDLHAMVTSLSPVSDKFTDHTYQTMYGMFLWPWRAATKPPKILEVGLGCDMTYGPGASVKAWRLLLPESELWEADYNAACVEQAKAKGQLEGINTLIGDQADKETLKQWVMQSGGKFDVVIDDGGHANKQIMTSFEALWPEVVPGGLYFIEDLQVGRRQPYLGEGPVMWDIIRDWQEQLVLTPEDQRITHKIPDHVLFIFCQREACVVGKDWQ